MLVELYECPLEGEDVNGCTALFYAVSLKHSNACQVLLDLKANPNHQDHRGRTYVV
jgi:ankyrin repeat protein